MRELCLASSFIRNKSALKMYREIKKKNWTNRFHGNPFHSSSALYSPRESLQPCMTMVQTNSPQASTLVCCRAQNAELGVQLARCCSRQSPLGFQFCADPCECALIGKIIDLSHLHAEVPRGGSGRCIPSVSSSLILRMSVGP